MQLSIFNKQENNINKFELYTDGASRNNPGKAGIGIYILKNNNILIKTGYYLGIKTNNQAEYLALFFGLSLLIKYINANDKVQIKSDSELLIKQITGKYKVKNPALKKIYNDIINILSKIKNYEIIHIKRELNNIADKLANIAIDKEIKIPEEFNNIKEKYGL